MSPRTGLVNAAFVVAVVLLASACGSLAPSPSTPWATGSPSRGATSPTATAGATASPPATAPAPTSAAAPAPSPTPLPSPPTTPAIDPANVTPWPVAMVSAGWSICAVGTDGRLRCWASDEGDEGADAAPRGRYASVAAGQGTSCGIRPGGTVVCWGWEPPGTPKGRYTAVSAGQGYACGIRTSGRVHCWWFRENGRGERIKDGERDPRLPDGRYTAVSVSMSEGGCALREDGLLACWDDSGTPPSPQTRYRALGDRCAVTMAGRIECFGEYEWEGIAELPHPPDGPFVAVDGTRDRGCALRDTGELACWGAPSDEDSDEDEDRDQDQEETTPAPPGTFRAVSVGEYYACAVRTDGRALCWGDDMANARPAPQASIVVPNFVLGDRIPVAWRATPLAARITGYDVEYTTGPWTDTGDDDPVAPWTRLFTGTRKTKTTLTGEEGKEYWWRVRAHDADGLVSEWAESYGTALPLDDRSLERTGPWTAIRGSEFFGGTALRTTTKGATLLISQEGAYGLVLLGSTCPGCGTFTLRFPSEDCADGEEAAGTTPPECPFEREDPIRTRGARRASAVVFMGNYGQEGYAGPLELVVTSSGKPVTIDAVIFADTE